MNNQASYIFGFVFLAFAIYITLKGELPIYAGLLLLSPPTSGGSGSASATQQQTANTIVSGAFQALALGGL